MVMTEETKTFDESLQELKSDFPNKGKYVLYDKGWNRIGYTDTPNHKGQVPVRFPEHWPPFLCFQMKDFTDVPLS